MKPPGQPLKTTVQKTPFGVNPAAFGICCCVFSAVSYTAVNICLRFMSTQCDKTWVIFVKELVTVVVVGPWFLGQLCRGRKVFHDWRLPLALSVMGLLTQWAGNLPCLWALSIVGLSVTVPIAMGVNLATSAMLGRFLLRERITAMSVFAIVLMCVSVLLLSLGAQSVNESIIASGNATPTYILVLAVAGAVMAGTVYALLAVTIRRTVTGSTPPYVVVFWITAMGAVTLGPWSLFQNGFAMVAAIPIRDHMVMILIGILNLIGFFAITKGLELTTVAHANVLSASQVAMGVLAGMLFFAEPAGSWLLVGVSLAIAAIIMIRPACEEEIELSAGV